MNYRVLITILLFTSLAHGVEISREIFRKVPFVSNTADGRYGSYLAQNIFFPPVKGLFYRLDERLGGKLNKRKARIEAHITAITPIEYRDILQHHISIHEINDIALRMGIQSSRFEIVCLGKASTIKNNKKESTYYLVVKSPNLLRIRRAIHNRFKDRNHKGEASKFDPNHFYPHITIGYTFDDLHLDQDKVFKGINSCVDKNIHIYNK